MTRMLTLTPEQAEGLRELMLASLTAQDRLQLGLGMVLRGHGILEASNPSLTGNILSVTVPDEEP
jgi:hypothetical protein